jgi:hypothetical protein
MRYLCSALATLAWAAWFGGLLAAFIIIKALFAAFGDQPDLFGDIGSAMFHAFEKAQLFMAGAALILTFIWIMTGTARSRIALFVLLCIATLGAVCQPLLITPRIDHLRLAHQTQTPQFLHLHGISMIIYSAQLLLLLAGGILLPAAWRTGAAKVASVSKSTATSAIL